VFIGLIIKNYDAKKALSAGGMQLKVDERVERVDEREYLTVGREDYRTVGREDK
jgi:hypothetical protein